MQPDDRETRERRMVPANQHPQQISKDTPRPQRTIGDALHELFSNLADSWIRPLEGNPLTRPWRFGYAFAGSLPVALHQFHPFRRQYECQRDIQ